MSVAVHHEIAGPDGAPAVVLSNSLGTTLTMWDKQVAALAQRFRVVRYDTRGHGRSPVPPGPYSIDDVTDDVIALLDRLGLERAHFVGLSLGGMTGMRLAARNPDRVDRLVVLCTSALLEPSSAWRERAAAVRAGGAGAVARAVVGRWYTSGWRERNPDLVAAAEEMVRSTPPEGYAGCCEAIAEMDLTGDLPSIAVPVLAVAGADDPATPPSHLKLISSTVKDGRLLIIPDAAHLANDEQPGIVTEAILEHLTAVS